MKKLVLASTLIMCLACVNGQRGIDRLLEKYSDTEGFSCISFSGDLLNFTASFEEEGDDKEIKAKISQVKILSKKDHHSNDINFYDLAMKNIDIDDYEELMSVRESDQDLRVLVRLQGRRITEFLLVAGGEDNAIVQIKGNMSVSDAQRLCDKARRNNSSDIF
ncbi:MAG TPA: DUF4252 domain-containing protein [Bacteroidales bacterium]|nr:DUF4252 domain-containing protein [Bacteroidales bacterium]